MGGEAERTYIAWYFDWGGKEQVVLRWAFTACIGTSHTGGILRIFVQRGFSWMEKLSRWMFFFLFYFLQKLELLSSHNFDKSELFSWHKFKSSRIHGCFHSPRANDVVLESLWQSNTTKENCENEEKIFRDTVFLMFSLVLQHFSLERCSQHKLPSLDSVGGLTIGPQEYWATIKRSM